MRRQLAWSFAAHGVGLVLPPILLVALARALSPEDFGVFSLLTVVLGGLQTVVAAPLGEVVVQSRRDDVGDFSFTLQMFVGVVLALLLVALAGPLAWALGKPQIQGPLRVYSALLILTPLVETAIRIRMRGVDFRAVFVRRISSPVGNAVVSLPLAYLGFGFWALVWGQLSGIAFTTFVVLALGAWRPRLNFRIRSFADDLRFSGQMVVQGLVRWVKNQADKAILGYHLPLEGLGEYDLAGRLGATPFAAISDPVAQVMYAVMADRVRQGKRIAGLFLLTQRRILLASFPVSAYLAWNAESVVEILLGPEWKPLARILIVVVLIGALSSSVRGNNELFKALGRPGVMTRFMLIRAVATLPVFLLLAPQGALALATGSLVLGAVFSPINIWLTLSVLGVTPVIYLRRVALRPVILAVVVVGTNWILSEMQLAELGLASLNLAVALVLVAAAFWRWEPGLLRPVRAG